MAVLSFQYLLFLLILAVVYFAVGPAHQKRNVLLAGSFLFLLFFNWLSAVVVLLAGFINYKALTRLMAVQSADLKKNIYHFGIFFNAGLLLFYKMLQLALTGLSATDLVGFDNNKWILLGIGFYSLQLIGYYFEVYKKRAPFEYTLPDFLLSILFFAKLPAGPILKINESINKTVFHAVHYNEADISYGIQRILLGIFKKVALADRLLLYVSNIFDHHTYINGLTIYLGPILFTMQVYFDFSAYIDIAIGSARLFGIRLPENFYLPLRATSISAFWRRWHITLVRWLTEYVFYPLSFRYRKLKKRGLAIAVVCTFLVSAAWHGLALTFFIWAFCHFLYIIIENAFFKRPYTARQPANFFKRSLQVLLVWHLVAFANLFFRANTLGDALRLFRDMGHLPFLYDPTILNFKIWLVNGGQDIEPEFNFRVAVLLGFLFLLFEKRIIRYAHSEKFSVLFVALLLMGIAVLGLYDSGERFIYLQF